MKELRRKTFLTIFFILSSILIVALVFLNIQNYNSRKESIERSLNIIDDRRGERGFRNDQMQGQMPGPEEQPQDQKNQDIDKMMIMDQEVYSVELLDGQIVRIIEHGDFDSDFDAESAAKQILESNNESIEKIGNLYTADYSYKYKEGTSIAISNNESVRKDLFKLLVRSLIILIVMEVIIYLLSTVVTRWITKPAEDAFQKQKEFIADASHELKTPLAVIMASADELSDKSDKYVENIRYESDRMNKLIQGMLNLSKLEEGLSKDTYKEENLSKIVEKTALVFEGIAYENQITIDTDIEEGIKYKCSKEDIEKMVSTIIDNAIKHSYKDSTVKVVMKKEKSSIEIEITNSGDPIPEGDEERIFERFYRADKSRSRSDNRYGLGLAIAKSIAVNHDGDIAAYSSDGKTTFKIRLG